MSIEQSFENKSEALISPEEIYGIHEKIVDTCIVTFSHAVLEKVLKQYSCKKVASTATANGKIPVCYMKESNVLFYMSPIGSAIAGTIIDEVRCLTGAAKFIFFGSCGILDEEKCGNKIIIPTEAYRDEGFSYHLVPKSDYIKIQKSEKLSGILKDLNYICGKTWTTDAFYRET